MLTFSPLDQHPRYSNERKYICSLTIHSSKPTIEKNQRGWNQQNHPDRIFWIGLNNGMNFLNRLWAYRIEVISTENVVGGLLNPYFISYVYLILFPFGTGLRIAFLASYRCISGTLRVQFGNNWEQICCNSMVILAQNRRNRQLFYTFPLPAHLSHWRRRGFESRQVHFLSPTYGGLLIKSSLYWDDEIDRGSCLIHV